MSKVQMKLELIAVPVSDVDRAKAFYVDQVGFNPDHDHTVSDELRFVQLTPPGSACSIAIGRGLTEVAPGSVQGLQVVVEDIEAARAALEEQTAQGRVNGHFELRIEQQDRLRELYARVLGAPLIVGWVIAGGLSPTAACGGAIMAIPMIDAAPSRVTVRVHISAFPLAAVPLRATVDADDPETKTVTSTIGA